MPKAHKTWNLLPHRPVQNLEDNLLRVQGELPNISLKRVMTVARRRDGKVVIHNGIALDDSDMATLEAFGELAYLVIPGGYHRLDACIYKERYPELQVVCPKGAVKKVQEVIDVDLTYDQFPDDPDVELEHIRGTEDREGVMILPTTLVFNDLIFNMPHLPGVTGWVFRYLTKSSGGPRISRIAHWFMVADAKEVAEHLESLAKKADLSRIIVSHHEMITHRASETLLEIASSIN